MRHACMALLVLLAACDGGSPADNRREVEKQQRGHDLAPTFALDEALQAEGTAMAGVLVYRMQTVLLQKYGGDKAKLAADLQGPLDDAKLAKLGTSATEFQGKNYAATDYSLSFSGDSVTITASKPGTRGFISEAFQLR